MYREYFDVRFCRLADSVGRVVLTSALANLGTSPERCEKQRCGVLKASSRVSNAQPRLHRWLALSVGGHPPRLLNTNPTDTNVRLGKRRRLRARGLTDRSHSANVGFGSFADIGVCIINVCFALKSRHSPTRSLCPLSATSGHERGLPSLEGHSVVNLRPNLETCEAWLDLMTGNTLLILEAG